MEKDTRLKEIFNEKITTLKSHLEKINLNTNSKDLLERQKIHADIALLDHSKWDFSTAYDEYMRAFLPLCAFLKNILNMPKSLNANI